MTAFARNKPTDYNKITSEKVYSMRPEEFDFVSSNTTGPPVGYPTTFVADTYSREPFLADYDQRREAYLDYLAGNPARPTLKGFLYELARLAKGAGAINLRAIEGALRFVNERIDCADFVLLGIIRLVLQFGRGGGLPGYILEKAEKAILGFKYWPDEPGRDSMCSWTENHQILFSTCEYLAGMTFPERVFVNSGVTGREKMRRARPRLLRWIELRFRTGFNEWLSNVYYDEDIAALVTLADFCDDPPLVRAAQCVLDLLFYDMSLNSFRGTFGSTHGRSYERQKKSGFCESTADAQKLMFGMGVFGGEDNMSGTHLALSRNYRLPRAIYEIASDFGLPEMTSKQRAGIKITEARRWGLSFTNLDDGMVFLSFEAYNHPRTFRLFTKMLDAYNWWDNRFFRPFRSMRRLIRLQEKLHLMGPVAWLLRKDIARNMREEVHTVTHRTPDYMLSAALEYKKGWGGDQQHIWQATLSEEAICFTTHPGSMTERSPDYWTGSGFLPRVAMYKNVLAAVYKIPSVPGLYVRNRYNFTHAYFPKDKFDEVVEKKKWLFGKKGSAYIALYSRNGYRWQERGKDRNAEIIADGKKNIWLCEMGREEAQGSFREFQESVSKAKLTFRGMNVSYHSPTCGKVEFGWRGGFRINGKRVPLRNHLRYDNPYSQTEFDPEIIEIRKGKEWLRLELESFNRKFSSTI
ncbi:MAG: hypothetical protein JSV16_04865 [Candidatus Hydrogenedentota bacterium]|nr:MAG: hypothetical protein JSV16_04865 [Candidatus Hydrogenedentota bacterium]